VINACRLEFRCVAILPAVAPIAGPRVFHEDAAQNGPPAILNMKWPFPAPENSVANAVYLDNSSRKQIIN